MPSQECENCGAGLDKDEQDNESGFCEYCIAEDCGEHYFEGAFCVFCDVDNTHNLEPCVREART